MDDDPTDEIGGPDPAPAREVLERWYERIISAAVAIHMGGFDGFDGFDELAKATLDSGMPLRTELIPYERAQA